MYGNKHQKAKAAIIYFDFVQDDFKELSRGYVYIADSEVHGCIADSKVRST